MIFRSRHFTIMTFELIPEVISRHGDVIKDMAKPQHERNWYPNGIILFYML